MAFPKSVPVSRERGPHVLLLSVAAMLMCACAQSPLIIEDGHSTHLALITGTVKTAAGVPATSVAVEVVYPPGSVGFSNRAVVTATGTFVMSLARLDHATRALATVDVPVYLRLVQLPPKFAPPLQTDSTLTTVTFGRSDLKAPTTQVHLTTKWP